MSTKEHEGEAVRTTIVGGRPSGSGRGTGTIPRGVEVLLKKAAVDDQFRELLCEQRTRAAEAIGLELDPAESALLTAIPREQLESIIARTLVPVEQRRVFLGRVAAPMLALLGVAVMGCPRTKGIQFDRPMSAGIRPVPPGANPSPTTPPATNWPVSPVSDGIRPDRPASAGIRPQAPGTNQSPAGLQPATPPSTDPPVIPPTQGLRPDRP